MALSLKIILRKMLPIKKYWPQWMLKYAIEKLFERQMGYKLDLKNPRTFNEKMQWYKLYYKGNDIIKGITDKYKFKSYIAEKLGTDAYTAKLYGHWYYPEDLRNDWDKLPEEFCLKCNLSCNGNNMKFIRNKKDVDLNKLLPELRRWLDKRNTLMNACCCRFNDTEPCILAEELLKQDGGVPNDYKIYSFAGKPYCIYCATDHFVEGESAISFYDLEWNRLDVRYADYKMNDVARPEHLDEMLDITKKLSEGFPFVRVDFFEVNNRIYLSEMTFDSGDGHRRFDPFSFDEELGRMIVFDKA